MKFKFFKLTILAVLTLFTLSAKAAVFPAGSLDPTFGSDKNGKIEGGNPQLVNGDQKYTINKVLSQTDGKIVVLGERTTRNSPLGEDFLLARYTADGQLDKEFNNGNILVLDMSNGNGNDSIRTGFLQGDKIVVAGHFTTNNGDADIALARFNSNGTLDASFGTQGVATFTNPGSDESINSMDVQSDGKIVVNIEEMGVIKLARFTSNGILDNTFGNMMIAGFFQLADPNVRMNTVVVQKTQNNPDKILLGGKGGVPSNFFLLRTDAQGTALDNSFGSARRGRVSFSIGGNNDEATRIVLQPDGKIVAGGTANRNFALVRCNDENCSSNTPDFVSVNDISGEGKVNELTDLALQPDGSIVAVGSVQHTFSSRIQTVFGVVRYNANGALDTSFNGNGIVLTLFELTQATNNIALPFSLAIQSDGKIVVGGLAQTSGGFPSEYALARYLGKEMNIDTGSSSGGGSGGGCSLSENSNSSFLFGAALFLSLIFLGSLRMRKAYVKK